MEYCASSIQPGYFSGKFADAGLLILSRYPIVEQEFREFKAKVFRDHYVNKGVLYAKIHLGEDFYLHLFNTQT